MYSLKIIIFSFSWACRALGRFILRFFGLLAFILFSIEVLD